MDDRARDDERFMADAIALSYRHLGQTDTNPSVGCVIVRSEANGPVVVGSAVTAIGGRPHAETQALALAGEAARGATAYVTLEPCAHFGKTPPCANALVDAGIARVVISVVDPDERVAGQGIAILRDAGIDVATGVLKAEGERALEAYLMRKANGRPFVTLKLAVSANGMIGVKGQGQVRITGTEARAKVQRLRAENDAILVGIGTAIADDPELTVRVAGEEHRSPVRIVLDRRLELPPGSRLVRTARTVPVIAVADPSLAVDEPELEERCDRTEGGEASNADGDFAHHGENAQNPRAPSTFAARRATLQAAGVEVLECVPADLETLLAALATRGISSLFVEGGAKTAQAFLNAGLVDRILIFTGPATLGSEGVPSPLERNLVPVGFAHRQTMHYGDDLLDIFDYERKP